MIYSTTQISQKGLDAGPNMHNRKPYRSKVLKAEARKKARKDADGAWRSSAATLIHDAPRNTR